MRIFGFMPIRHHEGIVDALQEEYELKWDNWKQNLLANNTQHARQVEGLNAKIREFENKVKVLEGKIVALNHEAGKPANWEPKTP
jgi:hypothetical protein